jgi:hypothetical protein
MSHQHNTFHNPGPATAAMVLAAIERADSSAACDAIVGSALHGDGDWKELQDLYLSLLDGQDPQVSSVATICLGHLARVYRQLEEDRVVPVLRRHRRHPTLGAAAANALDDIELFLHPRRTRLRSRARHLLYPGDWNWPFALRQLAAHSRRQARSSLLWWRSRW